MLRNHLIQSIMWVCMGCRFYSFGAIAAAAVGAAAAIGTSVAQSSAAKKAGRRQEAASKKASENDLRINREQLEYLRESRDQANAVQKPFQLMGMAGQGELAYRMGLVNHYKQVPTGKKYVAPPKVNPNKFTWGQYSRSLQADGSNDGIDMFKKMNKRSPMAKAAFKRWQQAEAKTAYANAVAKNKAAMYKQVTNNDANYGSLSKNFNESFKDTKFTGKYVDKPFTEKYVDKPFTEKYVDKPFVFHNDPGYQFRKDQGNRDLQGRLAAMGMSSSGSALKEGMKFNQGLADQSYQDAFNRYQTDRNFGYGAYEDRKDQANLNRNFSYGAFQDRYAKAQADRAFNYGRFGDDYGRYSADRGFRYNAFNDRFNRYQANRSTIYNQFGGLSGTGQQAANQIASNNTDFGAKATETMGMTGRLLSSNIEAAGNARAASAIGQSNAWANGLNGIASAAGNYFGNNKKGA